MLIFILSLLSMTGCVLVFMIAPMPKKVVSLSILSILLILLNFINQLDIILNPPSYNAHIINNPHKTTPISFIQQIKNQQMINMAKQIQQIRKDITENKEIYLYQEGFIQLFQDRAKRVYQDGVISKDQQLFVERLITGVRNWQDQVLTLGGLHKARMEMLVRIFLTKVKTAAVSRKVTITMINQEPSSEPYVYVMPKQSLKQGSAHYIFVLSPASDALLDLLYKQYMNCQQFLSIILLNPPVHFEAYPLFYWSYPFQMPIQSFLHPILSLVHQSHQLASIKLLPLSLSSLQVCKKYITFDYQFWLKVYFLGGFVELQRICYGHLPKDNKEIQCIRKFYQNQQGQQHINQHNQQHFNEELQYHINKLRHCWANTMPKGLILTNNKIKLKKQYFYANQIDQTTFGIQNNSKMNICNNTQQL